jgi:CRISPR-associated protein Cas2
MAGRLRYLLTYDIRDPKRLRRVHTLAKAWGDPLQYSVFVCDLTKVELVELRRSLIELMKLDEDSVSFFDLGPPSGRGLQCIEFIGTRRRLPDARAQIW